VIDKEVREAEGRMKKSVAIAGNEFAKIIFMSAPRKAWHIQLVKIQPS